MKKLSLILFFSLLGFLTVNSLFTAKAVHAEPCSEFVTAAILAFGDEPCDPDDDGTGGGGGGGGSTSMCAETHYNCNRGYSQVNEADDLYNYEWSCTDQLSGAVENCTEPTTDTFSSISIDSIVNSTGSINSSSNPQDTSASGVVVHFTYDTPGGTATLDNVEVYVDGTLFSYGYSGGGVGGSYSSSVSLVGISCGGGSSCTHTVFLVANFTDTEFNNNYGSAQSGTQTMYFYAPAPVNGACGPAGQRYVCSAGSVINQSHPYNSYTWSCTGSYGGSNASCSLTPSGRLNPTSNPSVSYPAVAASCAIPAGSSSCKIDFFWSTVNYYDYVSRILRPDGTLVIGNTLSEASYPFTLYGSDPSTVTFSLYNGDTLLARSNVSKSCASGSTWNGAYCMNGTLTSSASSCTIASGAGTCNVTISWSTAGPNGTSAVTSDYPSSGYHVADANSGSNQSVAIPKAGRSFYLYNSGTLLAQKSISASCASGSAWTGSTCEPIVNGACSAAHYGCSSGTSASNSSNTANWTWSCTGANGGTSASCSEPKYVDLTAGAVTPTTAVDEVGVTLSATVTNNGTDSTSSSFSNFFQVATAENGGGTITNLAASSMSTLAAGASSATTKPYSFSPPATYSVRACADKSSATDGGTITESNENNNCGPWTNVVVENRPPPTPPSGLTAEAVSKTAVDLEWDDNSSGETSFKIERKTGASGTWEVIGTVNPNKEDYSDTGLSAGTTYYYRVKATNQGGDSAPTNEAVANTAPYEATISVNVTPDNASWTINPGNQSGTGDGPKTVSPSSTGSTYTITPGSAPSGYDFPPTVTNSQGGGSSMTLFDGGSASFTITYVRSFDYTLSNNGMDPVQKGGGSYVAYGETIVEKELAPDSGAAKSVDLSVSGIPSGVALESISGNPAEPDSSSSVKLAVSSSAAAGTYPITVTGSPLGKTTVFNLIIENSPDIFVSCVASGTRQVGQEITWTANVTQTPSLAPYTYYWTGTNIPTEPAPSTVSFPIVYSTTGTKTANVLIADSKGNTGVCNPQGSINIGVTPIFEEF